MTSLERAGVAARAEFVVGPTEMGLTAAYRHHGETDEDGDGFYDDDFDGDGESDLDLKVGFDFSAGIWDFDVTSEVGLTVADDEAPTVQVAAGLQYGVKYNDEDVLYLGVEYFYNQVGHDSLEDAIDTALEAYNAQRPIPVLSYLYSGKHYGGLSAVLQGPGSWNDTNFSVTTLGNFSDLSFIARLDVSVKVLTYLSVQAFAQFSFGNQGELRLGPEVLGAYEPALDLLEIDASVQVGTLGLWLRLDI
mgnify:FL=1